MRRITQRATVDADVADWGDMGHRTESGRVEFDVTWPWDEDDADSHGPDGPQITVRIVTDNGDDIGEATLGPAALDTVRHLLYDLDRDYRWNHAGERRARVALQDGKVSS